MRLLLVAYAYPPLWEAQSVRWYYLSKELAKAGFQVDVLTVEYPGKKEEIPGIKVYRTFPGPFNQAVFKALGNPKVFSAEVRSSRKFLFIKKLYRAIRKITEYMMLGDIRNEWFFIAYPKALELTKENNYDLLITSHEPMVDTLLGLALKNRTKIKWIADLADPISADYYPKIWKPFLKLFERKVLAKADFIIVTNEALKRKYEKIINSTDKILLISQGFDLEFFRSQNKVEKNKKFTLAYTGSFYKDFREPKALVEALAKLNFNFELWLAGRLEGFLPLFKSIQERVKYFGVLSHPEALELQAKADVLVYLGNRLESQVPGKFYEYLGSKKPILCIIQHTEDPVAGLVRELRIGEVCLNEPEEIARAISKLYEHWLRGEMEEVYRYEEEKVREFSWQNQAQKLIRKIKELMGC
ncbi:MAG: glycosyltransferase family 4 protein [Thermodesulfobacterium sp.]|nr:glycosyltransferase family 4 protein [Thermodesulfobacterium sp.]